MKKTIVFLVLAGIITQCLTSCSLNPSESEKKEASQEISRIESEINKIEEKIDPDKSETEKAVQSESPEEETTGDYQAKAEELSAFLMENIGVTTIQYTIMDGDEIVLSNMTGVNNAWNKPVLCIGSSSKMYVTAAVMMLVDQGKIDLDTPVVQYMPEFTMADARYKEITPRMLLNHSAGLYGTSALYGNSMSLGTPSTVGKDTFFEYKKGETLKTNPGEMSVYSNDCFVMAEFLVEDVSGMTYTDFIKENISKPLGLTYTTTAFDPELNPDDITPMPKADGSLMPTEYMNYPGTGGIYSTTEEMCKFARLFMGTYPEILSEESAQLTFEPEYLNGLWVEDDSPNAVAYGLGWDDVSIPSFSEYGIRAVGKGGDTYIHHADLTVLPDHGISMAVLSNGGKSSFNAMFSTSVLLEYLYSKGIIENVKETNFEFTAPIKADMPEELKKYEGLYGAGSVFPRAVQITIDNGEIAIPGGMGGLAPDVTFVYTGNNEFTSEDGTSSIYFKEEENGEVYIIKSALIAVPGLGATPMVGHEFQKLEPQQLSESVKSAWQARAGKRYLCVSEIYNSANYTAQEMTILGMVYSPEIDPENGYISGNKIIDASKAVNVLQIPVMNGRDAQDFLFFESNGKNYLNKCNQIFISEEHVLPFDITGEKSAVIGAEGYAEWFSIDAATAGKEVKITIPEKSAVYILDEGSISFDFSIEAGERTFTLPSGGFIIFAGDAGAEFEISMPG